jgi:hypothetical protein
MAYVYGNIPVPPIKIPERITDEKLHPLIDSEKQRVPQRTGVVILYDNNQIPIGVECDTMLNAVLAAHARYPQAAWFSLIQRYENTPSMMQLVDVLRKNYGLVRKEPIGFAHS